MSLRFDPAAAMRRALGALALVASLPLLPGCAPAGTPGQPPRHVLLVTAENLRADHLSAYQYARPTSLWTVDGGQRALGRAVAIDDLAADGVLFANAFSPAESKLLALKSLHAAQLPAFGEVVTGMESDAVTLAERFQEAGYTTAAFVSGELLGRAGGFTQGFDVFRQRRNDDESLPMAVRWIFEHDLGSGKPVFLWIHLSGAAPPFEPGITAPLPGPEADELDYLRLHFELARAQDPDADPNAGLDGVIDSEPWEVTAWDYGSLFCDPEYAGPANGSQDWLEQAGTLDFDDRRRVIDLYDGDVAELASRLRSFLLAYQTAGEVDAAWDDTLVVVCGVNGIELGERGRWGESLYTGNLRVPLLFFHPNSILGRRILDTVCDLTEIGPTLLEWTGAAAPGPRSGRAPRSLASLLDPRRKQELAERPVVTVGDGGLQAASLRTRRWALVWQLDEQGVEAAQLFDRVQDPLELRDVAAEHPDLTVNLRDTLVGLLTEADA